MVDRIHASLGPWVKVPNAFNVAECTCSYFAKGFASTVMRNVAVKFLFVSVLSLSGFAVRVILSFTKLTGTFSRLYYFLEKVV